MLKHKITYYLENLEDYPRIIVQLFGLYPFFHYYNSNLSEAASWQQLVFLLVLCFVIPQILYFILPLLSRLDFMKTINPRLLSIFCWSIFFGLIGFFMFYPHKKKILGLTFLGCVLGWLLFKYLNKVVVIQFILIGISIVSLVPKLVFHLNQDNSEWALLSEEEMSTTFEETPNIFLIQPDGYVNFSIMEKAPYDYDNSQFEHFLTAKGFTNYKNFRSNYYSTYTSNSSMLSMKHHYYSNTNKATLKTHRANEIIVGKYNNVLKILKQNNYRSYLISENTYFLVDREPMHFDYCNVDPTFIPYHRSTVLHDIDISHDFSKTLDTISTDKNFIFIERTIPGHIAHKKTVSEGIEKERLLYLEELKKANDWLKSVIQRIEEFDENALIIIVGDHGGYVGLDSTMEVTERRLDEILTLSSFSCILSIKWPKSVQAEELEFRTNVNVFRNVFFALSGNKALLENKQDDSSFLPLNENGRTGYYRYINNEGVYDVVEIND